MIEVSGYRLALDRAYDPATHVWVEQLDEGRDVAEGTNVEASDPAPLAQAASRVRIGMDPLAVETAGTLAQLAFLPVGSELHRGEPFGSLEAAKFVGPLTSPLSGTIRAHNDAVVADPSLVERDPFGAGWLIELELARPGPELPLLVQGEERLAAWFAAEVEDYRVKGVLAE